MSTLESKPLWGKVAVVTGGGRGIGRGEALLLAAQGARVVVNDLGCEWDGEGADPSPAAAVAAEIGAYGGEAVAHYGDVSEERAAAEAIDVALAHWGRLDILVNNAGILRDWQIFNMPVEDWEAVVAVHLRAHFLTTRAACKHWRDEARSRGVTSGRIINTTSGSGLKGNHGQSNYSAAKAGIAALTQVVAMEMREYGVTVNAIAPSARTRLMENSFGEVPKPPGFDPIDPDNVAPLVAFLAGDAAAHITGQVLGIRGGIIELYEGWKVQASIEKAERWSPEEIELRIDELFAGRPTAYVREALTAESFMAL
jgi:NAD(P)-dependent dehydrogenase (short-subunit alcohol dehydrogenase family)